jgi:hypothetical protein
MRIRKSRPRSNFSVFSVTLWLESELSNHRVTENTEKLLRA